MLVRVRGIYATAISRILIEEGFKLADVSSVLAERLGVERNLVPPDVTVKNSDEDPDELIVIGDPAPALRLVEVLRRRLPTTFFRRLDPGPYSTLKVEVLNKRDDHTYSVRTHLGSEAVLTSSRELKPGGRVLAYVVKPGDPLVLREGVSLVSRNVVIESGLKRVSVSEHIRDRRRIASLARISRAAVGRGLGVRWRSSAKYVDEEALDEELTSLIKRLEIVLGLGSQVEEPALISEGESLWAGVLPLDSKEELDVIRDGVTPTTPLHHMVKSWGGPFDVLVEFADSLSRPGLKNTIQESVLRLLSRRLLERGQVVVEHVSPDGGRVRLGRFRVARADLTKDKRGLELRLERQIKSGGVYDGLGLPKEPGDYSVTSLSTCSWLVIHEYKDQAGGTKGVYVNINTKPEARPEGVIKYIDLYVDVVKRPGSPPEVIDVDQLEAALREGLVAKSVYDEVMRLATRLRDVLRTCSDALSVSAATGLLSA